MLLPANLTGILSALAAAGVWGAGDFSGGFATRRANQFHVLAQSTLAGLLFLSICTLLLQEPLPTGAGLAWATVAGVTGAIGLAALYRAISLGDTARVAPTAAVVGAIIPVLYSIFTAGLPAVLQITGFVCGLAGIWLVSQTSQAKSPGARQGFWLACLAGVSIGVFFITLALVDPNRFFAPLLVVRGVEFLSSLAFIRLFRLQFPKLLSNPIAWLAGVLDVGGNIFYLLARQYTRLDIAVVLASLYPATTVILAQLILKEKVTRSQWLGVALCLAAIALITV